MIGLFLAGPRGPWGDAGAGAAGTTPAPPTSAPPTSWWPTIDADTAQTALTLLPQVLDATTDPVRQVELLRAELRNAKLRGKSSTKIAKIEAKLRAAEARLQRFETDRASTREWSSLGKVALVTGVGFGLSLIFFVMAATAQQLRTPSRRRS